VFKSLEHWIASTKVGAMARPDPLANQPFSYATRADGTVVIRYRSAPVILLRGKAAASFMTRISSADTTAAQLLMARATGNFKRGNERQPSA
jgi:hypothetical protein